MTPLPPGPTLPGGRCPATTGHRPAVPQSYAGPVRERFAGLHGGDRRGVTPRRGARRGGAALRARDDAAGVVNGA